MAKKTYAEVLATLYKSITGEDINGNAADLSEELFGELSGGGGDGFVKLYKHGTEYLDGATPEELEGKMFCVISETESEGMSVYIQNTNVILALAEGMAQIIVREYENGAINESEWSWNDTDKQWLAEGGD